MAQVPATVLTGAGFTFVRLSLNGGAPGTFTADLLPYKLYPQASITRIKPTEGDASGNYEVTFYGEGFTRFKPTGVVRRRGRPGRELGRMPHRPRRLQDDNGEEEDGGGGGEEEGDEYSLVTCKFGNQVQWERPVFVSDLIVVCLATWGDGASPVTLSAAHGALAHRAPSPRCTAEAMHRVWHR